MPLPIIRRGSMPWLESTPPFTRIAYETILFRLIPPSMRRFERYGLDVLLAEEDAFGIVNMKLHGFTMRPGLEGFISSCFEVTLHLVVLHLRSQNNREVYLLLFLPRHQILVQPAIQEGFHVFLETDSFVQLRLQFADPTTGPSATLTTT